MATNKTLKKTVQQGTGRWATMQQGKEASDLVAMQNGQTGPPTRAPRWRMFGDGLPIAVAFEPAPPDTVRNPVEAWVWYAKAQGYPGPKAMYADLKASGVTLRIAEMCCCGKEVGHA